MTKFKLLYLKNGMLFANGIANFTAVFFVQNFIFRAEPLPDQIWKNPIYYWTDIIFPPVAFIFVAVMTLLYEQQIRIYLNTKFRNKLVPEDLENKARQRLLNEPFILITLDLSMWLLAAVVYTILHLTLDSGSSLIQRTIFTNLSTGFITVTLAFFLLEHVLQKRLAPLFFPEGGLCEIPKTLRIRIRTRLAALLFACNLIPLFSIIHIFQRIVENYQDPFVALNHLRQVLLTSSYVFIGAGICLTMLVSRNLTLPFEEIIQTLRGVRNGDFEKKVRVTSNDEIGYTGDVINEMTVGLQEREMIKDTFGKYVAKEVRDEVLSGKIPLDGEKKDVTILFSDLRNFTSMTEKNDPKLVVKILNLYFKEMADVIQKQAGLVLQFIGDEIYAVFGAPVFLSDHPAKAFRAGLEMNHRLEKLNTDLREKGWPILQHGIGIHTGEALAAIIGSPDRLSYLLVGDTVNLASRLQSLSKEVGTEMIISEATHARLTESELVGTELRQLPSTQVKGKSYPVGIFAVV